EHEAIVQLDAVDLQRAGQVGQQTDLQRLAIILRLHWLAEDRQRQRHHQNKGQKRPFTHEKLLLSTSFPRKGHAMCNSEFRPACFERLPPHSVQRTGSMHRPGYCFATSRSRSSRLRILPAAEIGSASRKTTDLGTL